MWKESNTLSLLYIISVFSESSEPPTALSEEPAAKKPAMDRPDFQPPLQDQRPPSQGQGLLPTPDNYGAPPMARYSSLAF